VAAPTIFVSLSYNDAPAAIEWLCRVFGFRQRLVVPGPDGSVLHSELSFGSGVIMVSSARPEQGRLSPLNLAGSSAAISVYTDDPDSHYAVALAAGAEIVAELKDEKFGARGYMAKDLEGHPWYFASYRPGVHWDELESSN
jgi:uncharacterized glyoxalase superfamily protein PhnB